MSSLERYACAISDWDEESFVKLAKTLKRDFAKEFKQYGITIKEYIRGYFYVSLFVEKNDKFVYISVPDIRYFPWGGDAVLYREAKNEKDFVGRNNCYAAFTNVVDEVQKLLNNA